MISLRPYQIELSNRSRASMESGKRAPLLVAPCGAGKTVMFCDYTKRANEKGKRVIILSHREELVEQISETLEAFNVGHSFIAAGRPFDPSKLTQVASIMSLARRLTSIPKPDLLIIDEAHHGVAGSWKRVFDFWPTVRRIGVTATPERLSGEPLGEIFDDLIVGPSVKDLIDLEMLAPYQLFAPPIVGMDGVRTRMGDFAKDDLKKSFDKPTITGDAVAHYTKLAAGKRAIVFCFSVEHAKHVAAQFQAAGYRAACIDGSMGRVERRELVDLFRQGHLDVLTSCDLISEGFDLPAIEVAIMLRPTKSLALWIQQCGRALRVFEGKEYALILDHAGNTERHQWLPDTVGEWSLDGKVKRKVDSDTGPAIRTCPFCFAAQLATSTTCNFCGTLFGAPVVRSGPKVVDGELVNITPEQMERQAKARRIEQGMAETFEELVELGRRRKYSNPVYWAKNVWASRQRNKVTT